MSPSQFNKLKVGDKIHDRNYHHGPMIVTRVNSNNVEVKTDHADFYINVLRCRAFQLVLEQIPIPGLRP